MKRKPNQSNNHNNNHNNNHSDDKNEQRQRKRRKVESCPLCFEEYSQGKNKIFIKCNDIIEHTCCHKCFKQYLNSSNSKICPFCRQIFNHISFLNQKKSDEDEQNMQIKDKFTIANRDIKDIIEKVTLTQKSMKLLQDKDIIKKMKMKSVDKLPYWSSTYVKVDPEKVNWNSTCLDFMTPEEARVSTPPCGVAGEDIQVMKYSQNDPERRKNFFQPKFYTYFDDTAKYHSCLFEDG